MRVIAGTARRLPLKTIDGMDTRPTTDRIKETLFNILQNDVPGARFLDLFAGSGGIGIEALSRGASSAVFVDNAKGCAACISENLRFTHLDKNAQVLQCDVLSALSRLEGKPPFHIIFMDPPYQKGYDQLVLEYFSAHHPSYIDEDTLIIIEESIHADMSYISDLGFEVTRIKEYKTNMHVFLKLQEKEQ